MPAPVYIVVLTLVVLGLAVGKATGFATYTLDSTDLVMLVLAMGAGSPWFRRRYPAFRPLGLVVEVVTVVVIVGMASSPLSYAVQVFNNPLQDANFLAFDRALGFDYLGFMAWMTSFPALYEALGRVYGQFAQVAAAFFIIGLLYRREQQIGARFFVSFVIAVMLSAIISGLFPAEGAVILLDPKAAQDAFGASPLDHLAALRAGTMHTMPTLTRGGIISFPSMHVGLALLILYHGRRAPLLLAAFAPIALVFMFTALTHGAHYLADMIAAVPMIAVVLFLTETLFRRSAPATKLVAQVA